LPLLAGMALTFALVATLAAVGGGWVVQLNQYGRWLALVFVALFGLTLLLPQLAERLTRPLVAAGSRLSEVAGADARPRPGASFLIGVATAAVGTLRRADSGVVADRCRAAGASIQTTLLLLAYAAGAATSLAVALLLGGKVFAAMKRSIGAGEWLRRGLGAAMLAGVAAIALGLDTGLLARFSTASTGGIEQALVGRLAGKSPHDSAAMRAQNPVSEEGVLPVADKAPGTLPVEGNLPPLSGAVQWLNSPPLDAQALKGKVVLVDFWTYSCINCLRSLPYVKAWAEKYRDQGLVVIGVHAPEFAFERDVKNVTQAMKDLGINYPVAIDNEFKIWRAFNNEYWPAHYFADAQGVSAITTLAKASTPNRSGSSSNCCVKPARPRCRTG
jgi:thiol-disulfide isomerase/thioredoxin/cytochrome c biogenesis protein CcdA